METDAASRWAWWLGTCRRVTWVVGPRLWQDCDRRGPGRNDTKACHVPAMVLALGR